MAKCHYCGSGAKALVPPTSGEHITASGHYWRFRDGKVEYYRGSEDTQLTASTIAC